MRNILVCAAVLVALGGYVAKYVDTAMAVRSKPPVAQPVVAPNYSRTMTLNGSRDGHFHVEARADNASLSFIVDTGATLVAVRESDANLMHIFPNPSDYTAVISTANGRTRAARATIHRIDVGDITVYDVPALILPDNVLGQNLLGMAFLSKLRRYEVASGQLVLEQ